MNRASRYIIGQLLVGMVVTTAVLTGIVWLAISVDFVDFIINRGITFSTFAYLTMLSVPSALNLILPIAAFAVVAFIYSKLHSDRELVVLRAAGLSPFAIARPAIWVGLAMTVVSYTFSLWVIPTSSKIFRELQFNFRYTFSQALLKEGAFNDVGQNVTIYIRERNGESDLRGVIVHDTTDPNEPVTYIAERGVLLQGEKGPRVVVFDGNRQQLDKKTNKLTMLFFDRTPIELAGFIQKPDERYREARERGTIELFNLEQSDLGNPMDYGKFKVEMHQRFVWPPLILGLIIVTLVCLVAGEYSRRGQWKRILAALILNIMVIVASLGFAGLAAKSLLLVPLLYVNALIPIGFGLAFLLFAPGLNSAKLPSISRAAG